MSLTFKVYDPTNINQLGTLSALHGIGFDEDVRVPGSLVFNVDLAATADINLLSWRNVIRVNNGVRDIAAYVVSDTNSDYVSEDEIPTRSFQCPHILSWLGYDKGGAVLWPQGGIHSLQQSPRWFGPQGWDWDEPAGLPEPTTEWPMTRENWPDEWSERFVFDNRAEYRRVCTGADELAGVQTAIFFTTAWWTEARFFLDGAEINTLSTPVGDTTIRLFGFMHDGNDHVVYIDAYGTPPAGLQNALGFVWARVIEDVSGDYGVEFDFEGALYRSFNSTTLQGPTTNPSEPFWRANENYADGARWGVNAGFVMKTAVDEAQSRALLQGMPYNFDENVDSNGVAWTNKFVRSFGPDKLGQIVDSLSEFDCEATISADSILSLYQLRGTDRTTSVTIDVPFSLSSAERGPAATRYLTETQQGFGERVDTDAELLLGTTMEDYLSLGDDIALHIIEDVIDKRLGKDANPETTYEVELPLDVVPYEDVYLGDRVTAQSTENPGETAVMRILQFRCEVDDDTGSLSWSTQLEPWSE